MWPVAGLFLRQRSESAAVTEQESADSICYFAWGQARLSPCRSRRSEGRRTALNRRRVREAIVATFDAGMTIFARDQHEGMPLCIVVCRKHTGRHADAGNLTTVI